MHLKFYMDITLRLRYSEYSVLIGRMDSPALFNFSKNKSDRRAYDFDVSFGCIEEL